MSDPRPEQPLRAQDELREWCAAIWDRLLDDAGLEDSRREQAVATLTELVDARAKERAATLIEQQAAHLATLEQERDRARNSIRKAHDLVGRPTTDARHDLAACLIDGILNIQEGLGVARKAEDAAEARCKALEQERDELRAELYWIDAVLARRPALDLPTRRENIEKAIHYAKRTDEAERRAEAAEARCTAQAEEIARLKIELGTLGHDLDNAMDAVRQARAHTLQQVRELIEQTPYHDHSLVIKFMRELLAKLAALQDAPEETPP